jgi:hypothetical protein
VSHVGSAGPSGPSRRANYRGRHAPLPAQRQTQMKLCARWMVVCLCSAAVGVRKILCRPIDLFVDVVSGAGANAETNQCTDPQSHHVHAKQNARAHRPLSACCLPVFVTVLSPAPCLSKRPCGGAHVAVCSCVTETRSNASPATAVPALLPWYDPSPSSNHDTRASVARRQ